MGLYILMSFVFGTWDGSALLLANSIEDNIKRHGMRNGCQQRIRIIESPVLRSKRAQRG